MKYLIKKQEEKEREEIAKIVLRNFRQENFDKLVEEAQVGTASEAELLIKSKDIPLESKRRIISAIRVLIVENEQAAEKINDILVHWELAPL